MISLRIFKGALALTMMASAPCVALANPGIAGMQITEPGQSDVSQIVTLGLNKSMIVELDRPAADVVISNPAIADAVVQTSNRIIFRGVTFGQTNAFVFDQRGNQLLNLEISVEMDMTALHELVRRHVPNARVKVEGLNGNVMLTGQVDSLSESDQVKRLVSAYIGAGDETAIVNMLQIAAKDQVLLEVRIVEMQRNVIKQLGINLSSAADFGELANIGPLDLYGNDPETGAPGVLGQVLGSTVPFSNRARTSTSNAFPLQGGALGGLNTELGYTNYNGSNLQSSVGLAVDALERIGVVRTLAEPTLVAMSGESGNFLAGGEFPVPVGQDRDGNITVEFKPFGVGLGFTPVVLSEGRISLKISTEVSELTSNGALQGRTQTGVTADGDIIELEGVTIPALSVRRAESVLELPSGGSMMMAGLIQSKSRQSLSQLPGIKKVPILGALFQSRDFLNEETELVIIVTPYLVDPAAKNEMRTPADGFANASDAKTVFFGKLNEQYGKDGKPVNADSYKAPVGFIEE